MFICSISVLFIIIYLFIYLLDNDMHYPVRILNDYKHDDEGEWEQVDDDDDHSPISSKSYLSSSKKV